VLDSFTFTLDAEGNISQVLNADGTKFVYTYDQRHRVTNGTLKDSGNNNLRTFGYTYDAANNLTAKTRTITSPASSDSWVYGYDNANEQTSVTMNGGTPETRTYDAWGRMATRTQGTSSATYSYRYGGRQYSYATNFSGDSPETMQYRGDGRLYSRVSGTTTKVYRYDRGWNAINEEDGAGNLTATSVYSPTADVGERLAYTWGALSNGVTAYAYHDQLGSTRRWRWQSKGLLGANDFGPYGEPYAKSTVAPIDYALHVQDPYTGNFHAPYREYSAGWARWTTRDPLGMIDGPNEYGYVSQQPLDTVDAEGMIGVGLVIPILWMACSPVIGGLNRLYYDGFGGKGGMRPNTNDDYKHCTTMCRMSRYCANPISAGLTGILGEAMDYSYSKDAPESIRDMCSNADGLRCSFKLLSSCSGCCKSKAYNPGNPMDAPHPRCCNTGR